MPTGTIIKLVHLSLQTYQPTSKLISGHNDKGYGLIQDEGGGAVYFSHDAVPGRHGFDDLRRGQSVEYSVGRESKATATLVNATTVPAKGHPSGVAVADVHGTRFSTRS